MRRCLCGGLVALLGSLSNSAAADESAIAVVVEGGAEYDTNALRVDVVDDDASLAAPSGLMRAVGRVRLSRRVADRQRVRLRVLGGAKLYTSERARDESSAVVSPELGYDLGLRQRDAVVSAQASWFGTRALTEEPTARTFDNGALSLSLLLLGRDGHRVSLIGGVRRFRYAPDSDFSFTGAHYGARYATTIWRGEDSLESDPTAVDLSVSYRVEQRDYDGLAMRNGCALGEAVSPACFVPTRIHRADLAHLATAEVAYTGDRVYAARYELQVNDSNSFGQSLMRHRAELTVTSPLVWGVVGTARATAQYNRFGDSLLLARDSDNVEYPFLGAYDDENRNALVAHAARLVAGGWWAELRISAYTNEFATNAVRYRRMIGYLGFVYRSGE